MKPIPHDMLDRFGHLPDAQWRSGDEFSSACPQCGGGRGGKEPSDRFRFWERTGQASSFWCRRCGFQGFTDDNKAGHKPDLARLLELDEIRQRESAKEEARMQAKIQELQRLAYWRGYHDAMGNQQRELWRAAGIPNEFQDYWQLGFKAEYQGNGFTSPAMTIPYFSSGWQAQTIQYRLLQPPAPADKYRFQAGLKSALWMADPDTEAKGPVILCEGMKKAAVTFIEMVARGNGRYQVVAVPSKMPGADLLNQMRNADPLYIVLDPDAYIPTRSKDGRMVPAAVNRILKMTAGIPRRIVKLPSKADDFFTLYGGDVYNFERHLRLSVSI
jgi:hypothetical protein